jgi:hypothetical protein
MTWVVKLAFVSAVIYVGLILAINALLLVVARLKGSAGMYMSRPSWFVFFAATWTLSFWIAYRMSPLAGKWK